MVGACHDHLGFVTPEYLGYPWMRRDPSGHGAITKGLLEHHGRHAILDIEKALTVNRYQIESYHMRLDHCNLHSTTPSSLSGILAITTPSEVKIKNTCVKLPVFIVKKYTCT